VATPDFVTAQKHGVYYLVVGVKYYKFYIEYNKKKHRVQYNKPAYITKPTHYPTFQGTMLMSSQYSFNTGRSGEEASLERKA
jgi:hypothetical protein